LKKNTFAPIYPKYLMFRYGNKPRYALLADLSAPKGLIGLEQCIPFFDPDILQNAIVQFGQGASLAVPLTPQKQDHKQLKYRSGDKIQNGARRLPLRNRTRAVGANR